MADAREKEIKVLEKRLKKQPGSPLFARLADYYLEDGRSDDALRVCKEGLTHHPYYTTGHLMKGRVLMKLGKKEEARKSLNAVHKILPGIEAIEKLLADVGGPIEAAAPAAPVVAPAAIIEEPAATQAPPALAEELQPLESVVTDAPPTDHSDLTPEANFQPVAEQPVMESEAAPPVEETQEEFMARMRQELAGTENTLSLEDYLSGNIPPAPQSNEIGELADKLQGAKITPVIDLSRPADDGSGTNAGFVTPTLAEIYVKQGWYDDAIKAYKALAASKPELSSSYEQRITEIEKMKTQGSS